jgi:hypothetical protein
VRWSRSHAVLFAAASALGAGYAFTVEPPSPPKAPGPLDTSCVSCHSQLDGAAAEPTRKAAEDIHFIKGLSCHDCHGGNPAAGFDGDPFAAHDESKGWTGKPSRLKIPELCARCHADAVFMKRFDSHARVDQLSEYRTSVHGKKNAAGDERVAVCVDCHGVHGIRRVGDPLSSASPAKVTGTCGSCHGQEATLFREMESKRRLDLEACIRCVICHGNHAIAQPGDEMVGTGPGSTCTGCHAEGDPGYRAASQMSDLLAKLQGRLADADRILGDAQRAGVEVGPDLFALRKARDNLVEARVLVHSFDIERFAGVTAEGVAAAEEGVEAGRRAFAKLTSRRVGLSLLLVVIFAVIVSLALVIRRRER